jgi:hypothetical protein
MGSDQVQLNLPGMTSYDPAVPKVMKWRDGPNGVSYGNVAGDVILFDDNTRVTGYSKVNGWEVYHQCASRLQCLGMQHAPQTFRAPLQTDAGA